MPRLSQIDPTGRRLLWLCVAVGIGLRLQALFQPIGYDEAFTYAEFARHGLAHVLSKYTHPNNHILHSVGVWVSSGLFGNHPWALRLPAFLAGCALLPVGAVVLRRVAGQRVALLGTAWLAVCWPLVHYSANARGYSLQALLVLVALGLTARLRRGATGRAWAGLAIAMALGFWTLPTTLFPFGGLMLWLAIDRWRDPECRRARAFWQGWLATGFGTFALTLLLYAPVLLESGATSVVANAYTRPWPTADFVSRALALPLAVWGFWSEVVPRPVALLWLVGAALAFGLRGFATQRGARLWLPFVAWCALVLIVQHRVPPARVWSFALPLFLGWAAIGVVAACERWAPRRARALVFGLALLSCLGSAPFVAQHVQRLSVDPGRPEALASWLAERAAAEPVTFAAHFVLGHRVLYYAQRSGAQVVPTHRVGRLIVWRWVAAPREGEPPGDSAAPEAIALLDAEGAAGFDEFVALLEAHTGAEYRSDALPSLGDVAVRAIGPR